MKISCSPLLYGRTYSVDFGSQFLVQPDFFDKSDAEWSFSIVSKSMDHSDFVNKNGRQVIFGNGKFIVIGLAVNFVGLSKICGRELLPKYSHLDHENGREPHGFIGIVIKRSEAKNIFHIQADVLFELYCETIALVWDRTEIGNPVKISVREINVTEVSRELDREILQAMSFSYEHKNPTVFRDDALLCEKVSACVLFLALKGKNIVFCSNADEIRLEYRSDFDVVTCANPNSFMWKPKNAEDDSEGSIHEPSFHEVKGYDRILEMNSTQVYKGKNQNYGKSKETIRRRPKKGNVSSYDDILEQGKFDNMEEKASQGDDIKKKLDCSLDEEISRYNKIKRNKIDSIDGMVILGAAAGITYCIVGAVNSVNPVVLAFAGTVTLVFIGVEAKRIIDMYMDGK